MIFMMCRPRPGELLCSALMRTARRLRMTLHILLQRLFGEKAYITFHGWWQVDVMARALGMPRQQLIRENTDLPFFTCLMPQTMVDKAFHVAGTENEANVGNFVATAHVAFGPRRWCPRCTQHDVKVYGDSHWRVAHNLPGVTMCHDHKCRLHMREDMTSGVGVVRDIVLPHECIDGLPVGVKATPFFLKYAEVASRRLMSPISERVVRDEKWLLTRLKALDFCLDNRPIFIRELRYAFESLLGTTAKNILGDSVDGAIKAMARAPWERAALRLMPHRYLALQSALELDNNEIAPHLTGAVVFNGKNKRGVSPLDAPRAAIAARVIDTHIRTGASLPIRTVLDACGAKVRPGTSIYPELSAQLRRLGVSSVSARNERSTDLSDEQLTGIARNFIDSNAATGRVATVREVLATCGIPERRPVSQYPLFEALITEFQRSAASWLKPAALHDERQAEVARKMIDAAIANGTTLKIDDVLRECGHSTNRRDLGNRPLLEAEIKRLKASAACTRSDKAAVDARAAAIAAAFIDERLASVVKTSVKEVMRKCDLPLPYARLPGYPLLRKQLERLMRSRIAAYYKKNPKLNREGEPVGGVR